MHVIVYYVEPERACQTNDIFIIKKLVRSDGCNSKPGKIKKTVTIMAYTSRASRKTVEDAEIFQVLEESTDSDVTIFSSEEDEDCSESDSDEDGQLDDNSETNKKGGTRTSGPKSPHLNWTNTLNFKELRKYENLSGPKHSLPVGSSEKDFFELFVTNDFYNKVAEETNKYAALSQRKTGTVDNNWEDTNAEEIQAYIGILIYMGLVDLPEIEDYFQGDFHICPIVRQAMTLKRFKKLQQYLQIE